VLRSFAGGRLFGETTGDGPPAVLALHGWRRTHRDFDAVLAGPPDPIDGLALDLPGFGATPPPPEAWGSDDYARCVAAVLDEMAGPVVVLGHSFGGRVALQLAVDRPEAVRALVLTAVPLLPGDHRRRAPAPYRLLRALRRAGLVSEARLEGARQRYGSADYRAAEGVMRAVLVKTLQERYDRQLAAVDCPVALVWGDDDTETPLSVAEGAVERLARATLTVCPGAGHLTPLSVPEVLRGALEEHLG